MCFTGKCRYERGHGDSVGECTLSLNQGYFPDNALCVINDTEIDNLENDEEWTPEETEALPW